LSMNIYPDGDKTTANPVPVTVDTVMKYNYGDDANSYAEDTSADNDTLKGVLTPTYSGSTCDNFALEVHLKVLFSIKKPVAPAVTEENAGTERRRLAETDACACRAVASAEWTDGSKGNPSVAARCMAPTADILEPWCYVVDGCFTENKNLEGGGNWKTCKAVGDTSAKPPAGAFYITKVSATVVYGTYTGTEPVSIVRKSSLQFVQKNETITDSEVSGSR